MIKFLTCINARRQKGRTTMAFWRCYYHMVWATKHRMPLITSENESLIFNTVQGKTAELGGQVLAVNAVADHVRVAVSIPPKVAVAQRVKGVKGVSASEINNQFPNPLEPFRWQEGYGVLTFGTRNVKAIVEYINREKEHHANHDLIAGLEQTD
jgi:REP element-mobilizing transposase RayT